MALYRQHYLHIMSVMWLKWHAFWLKKIDGLYLMVVRKNGANHKRHAMTEDTEQLRELYDAAFLAFRTIADATTTINQDVAFNRIPTFPDYYWDLDAAHKALSSALHNFVMQASRIDAHQPNGG